MKFLLVCFVVLGGMLALAYHSDPAFFHALSFRAFYGPSFEREIAEHRAAIGMSVQDLHRALGEPIVTKRTEKSDGIEDQWFYQGKQITLKDGRVTQIESAELNPAAFRQHTESISDPPVSELQRTGGGGWAQASPTPTSSDTTREKMGLKGTALDHRPR